MSLINDALKRARDSQPADPAPPAAKLPPLAPVEPARFGGAVWMLALAAVLFLAAVGLFADQALFKPKNPTPVVVAKAPPPSTPPARTASAPISVARAVPPTPAASSATPKAASKFLPATPATNSPPARAPETQPKLQGVIFNAAHPVAIVSGQTVGVGGHVGALRVKEILPNAVVFQRADGSLKRLALGK